MRSKIFLLGALAVATVLLGAGCISLGGGSSSVGPMGMFRSVDKGDTWSAITAYPTAKGVGSISGLKIFRLYNDPTDPNAYYAATRGQGMYFTYNNGDSWQTISALAGKFIYGFDIDSKDKCTLYAADNAHIYKSTDCSRTWVTVYTEERPTQRFVSLAIDKGDSNYLYAAEVGGDILQSSDAGVSWKIVKRFGFDLQHLVADPQLSKRIYAAAYRKGLFRSDDGGVTWVDLNAGLNAYNDSKTFYRLVLNPAQTNSLFWISKYGILRSDDAGVTWSELKLLTPPGNVSIYAFAINPKNQKEIYYTGTILGDKNVHVRSTFYKSVDGGINWVTKNLPTNTVPASMLIHPVNTKILFLGFTLLDN
ncbi:MAG: hypothetical protein WCT40_00410 [Candidatus Magasanikbacteria bacterium]|jgi:photosystem II stability/assembly factor-like uncharacterized protein